MPSNTPKTTAITTEIIEIENVSFVPTTTRVNKSLPKSSVPKRIG